ETFGSAAELAGALGRATVCAGRVPGTVRRTRPAGRERWAAGAWACVAGGRGLRAGAATWPRTATGCDRLDAETPSGWWGRSAGVTVRMPATTTAVAATFATVPPTSDGPQLPAGPSLPPTEARERSSLW